MPHASPHEREDVETNLAPPPAMSRSANVPKAPMPALPTRDQLPAMSRKHASTAARPSSSTRSRRAASRTRCRSRSSAAVDRAERHRGDEQRSSPRVRARRRRQPDSGGRPVTSAVVMPTDSALRLRRRRRDCATDPHLRITRSDPSTRVRDGAHHDVVRRQQTSVAPCSPATQQTPARRNTPFRGEEPVAVEDLRAGNGSDVAA